MTDLRIRLLNAWIKNLKWIDAETYAEYASIGVDTAVESEPILVNIDNRTIEYPKDMKWFEFLQKVKESEAMPKSMPIIIGKSGISGIIPFKWW